MGQLGPTGVFCDLRVNRVKGETPIKTKSSNERMVNICQNWMQLVQERQRHRSLSSHLRFLRGAQGNPCLDMGSVAVLIPTVHEDRGLCHLSCSPHGRDLSTSPIEHFSRFKNVSWQVSNLITYSPAQESTLPLPRCSEDPWPWLWSKGRCQKKRSHPVVALNRQ